MTISQYSKNFKKRPMNFFIRKNKRRRNKKAGSLGFKKGKLPLIIPSKFANICTYVATRDLNPDVTGVIDNHVWRANSIYDPDYTGGGLTAKGYDTFMASAEDASSGMYLSCTVIGSRFAIEYINMDGTNPVRVGQYLSPTATSHATEFIALNDPDVQSRWLGPKGSGNERCVLKSNWSFKKAFGSRAEVTDEQYQTLSGANPQNPYFLHCFASNEAPAVDSGIVYCTARIEYICVWTQPISPDMT